MAKIIEFVCTGNHGRSPVAELIALMYLRERGVIGEYVAASSGTAVDAIEKDEVPAKSMAKIVDIGKERELYSADELKEIDQAIRDGNDKVLRDYFWRAADTFSGEEHEYRAEALKHFGIEGVVKEKGEQTIARPDTAAVFSMAGSNNEQVQAIYEGSGYEPVIDVLSRFATGNPDAALPDAFGKGKEEYFRAVEVLREHVPMAIDRLIN
jgi:protein-tyrosine-phosphatase